MTFAERVYKVCSQIPKGKVTTYKEIAKKLNTKAYRAVGTALRNNPYAPQVPCHRVVKSDLSIGGFAGKMEGPNITRKIKMLKKEGVTFDDRKVAKESFHKFKKSSK